MPGENQFDYLEQVLTSQSLQALRQVDAESRRRHAASMTANERAGFGVGNLLFGALSSVFGPGKKQAQLAKIGDAALSRAANTVEQNPVAEGPHQGLRQNLARAKATLEAFQYHGLPQDDIQRAQLAVANLQTQLEEAQWKRKNQEANLANQEAGLERTRLANEAAKRTNRLESQMYFVDEETGEVVGQVDHQSPAASFRANQIRQRAEQEGRTIVQYDREDMINRKPDALKAAQHKLMTESGFGERMDMLSESRSSYKVVNRLMDIYMDSESNPLTSVSSATRFGNRVFNEIDEFNDLFRSNVAAAEREEGTTLTSEDLVSDMRSKFDVRGMERQLSETMLAQLTWTITRNLNGSRPTDKDYERVFNMLGGGSGDPEIAIEAMTDLFKVSVDANMEAFDDLLHTPLDDTGSTFAQQPGKGRVLEQAYRRAQGDRQEYQNKLSNFRKWVREQTPRRRVIEEEDTERYTDGGMFSIPGQPGVIQ